MTANASIIEELDLAAKLPDACLGVKAYQQAQRGFDSCTLGMGSARLHCLFNQFIVNLYLSLSLPPANV